jgi:hypothetical protein
MSVARKYQIIQAQAEHVLAMRDRIRQADIDELWATSKSTPEVAMHNGLSMSSHVWVMTADGVPLCMFGVVPASESIGVPWLVGTVDLERHAMAFLRLSIKYVKRMSSTYNHLINFIDDRNVIAISWLKWLGFTMDEPAPFGPLGVMFRRFEMRA